MQTREYRIWKLMRGRCNNRSHPNYPRYGGRGIRVCERWSSFANFLADMGLAPAGLTIERKNNDGGYEPGNCRWATRKEQSRNTSTNRMIAWRGETLCLAAWAERFGVTPNTLHRRLQRSPLEKAMRPGLVVQGEVVRVEGREVRLRDEAAARGLPVNTVRSRLKRGLTLEDALTQPGRYATGKQPVNTGPQSALGRHKSTLPVKSDLM